MDALLSQAFEAGINALEGRRQLVAELVKNVSDAIKCLRLPCYGLVHVTDEQAEERARAIVGQLIFGYHIERMEDV